MTNQRPAADRVRPILAAMERSIDAARRRRTTPTEPLQRLNAQTTPDQAEDAHRVNVGNVDQTAPVIGRNERVECEENIDESSPRRLKARPKRPSSNFFTNDEGLQTRAG